MGPWFGGVDLTCLRGYVCQRHVGVLRALCLMFIELPALKGSIAPRTANGGIACLLVGGIKAK